MKLTKTMSNIDINIDEDSNLDYLYFVNDFHLLINSLSCQLSPFLSFSLLTYLHDKSPTLLMNLV